MSRFPLHVPAFQGVLAVWRQVVFAVLVVTALVPQASAQTPSNYDTARETKAGAELLSAVETHHLPQGLDKLASRLFQSAWGDFDFILRYFPNHPRALLAMSDLCQVWKSPKCHVEEYFEKAVAMGSRSPSVHLAIGIYHAKNKRPQQAVDSYKRALAIDPGSFNANYNIGLAYLDLKEYALANEHAQRAYANGPDLPGLRQKLMSVGAWRPLPPAQVEAKPLEQGGSATDGEQKAKADEPAPPAAPAEQPGKGN